MNVEKYENCILAIGNLFRSEERKKLNREATEIGRHYLSDDTFNM